MLTGDLVIATALGACAMAEIASLMPIGGRLALVEKGAGRAAFYALPSCARLGTVALLRLDPDTLAEEARLPLGTGRLAGTLPATRFTLRSKATSWRSSTFARARSSFGSRSVQRQQLP